MSSRDDKYSSSYKRESDSRRDDYEKSRSSRDRYDKDDKYKSSRDKYSSDDRHRSSRDRDRDRGREDKYSRDSERRSHKSSKDRSDREHRSKRHRSRSRSKSPKRSRDTDFDPSIYAASDILDPSRKFVWKKKEHKDRKNIENPEERQKFEDRRREENKLEIEKITQRRRQREDERRLIQEEKDRQLRLTDIQQLGDWETRETQFHLEQARKRAEIRIRDNRAEPIDLLAIHLKLSQQNSDYSISGLNIQQFDEEFSLEIDMKEPFLIFDNLPLHKVENLQKDIRMYLTLEQNPEALDFWNSLMIVCEDKLEELRASDLPLLSRVPEEVMEKIHKMLVDKNLHELDSLEKDIEIKLTSSSQINTDFWDQVLKSLKIWRAKLKLRIRHDELIEKRLEQLRVKQLRDAEIAQKELELSLKESRENPGQHLEIERCQSPDLFQEGSLPSGFDELKVIDPIEDFLQLQELRKSIVNRVYVPKKFVKQVNVNEKEQDPDDLAQKQLNELVGTRQIDHNDMELNEEVFDTELALPATSYNWEDKYRPRKPKYVNRVHTGYEWNKYNQTHYDVDNPPPRIVQGYKFNIFYPDLINQPSAKVPPPTYVIQRDPDSSEDNVEETEIIRFCAGPPYEDLAFKIVKRPWEKSHKMGFKSSFDRGVLQLHFFFKRQFYRR